MYKRGKTDGKYSKNNIFFYHQTNFHVFVVFTSNLNNSVYLFLILFFFFIQIILFLEVHKALLDFDVKEFAIKRMKN